MRKHAPLALSIALAAPASAEAAPPSPFGHACLPQNGVLFCPTASDAQRVPSFDGVPLDVDVTLPPSGDGPFPAIVMMHGYGGNKGSFQSSSPEGNGGSTYRYNDVWYASRGYAVITPSARGFGRSCGAPDSRTPPACDRGWIHLADHRYEARDTQHLLGLLADQGVVRPRAIGVTGISYGGIQSLNLARLRNRIRLRTGSFARWRSPNGMPLRIAAGWARWAGSDLTGSLVPNGRFLDFRGPVPGESFAPPGVMKRSSMNVLYGAGAATGYVAPPGADPSADLSGWRDLVDRGEPYRGDARRVARELTGFHSVAGLSGPSAPLLVQNGWTDDLFPATEALRVYATYRRAQRGRVSLQLGDLGHFRGGNKENADRLFNNQGSAFFDAWLKGTGRKPAHRSVTAFTQTCPEDAPAGGPFRARTWERLHPDRFVLAARRPQRVRSGGGNPETAEAFDPILADGACATVAAERARGTAIARRRIGRPFTMLGLPTVRATIRTRGRGGFLAARLFDVHRGRQTLVSRGVYRLRADQAGRIVFQLFGNGWRFRRGHTAKLELLGRDPDFVRTSNYRFSVRVSKLRIGLPSR
jgi:predicted acyl esterase